MPASVDGVSVLGVNVALTLTFSVVMGYALLRTRGVPVASKVIVENNM